MAFSVSGSITGLNDVLAKLAGVRTAMQRTILRKAVAKATKPIVQSAKDKCPKESGLLRKSIGRKVKTYRNSGVVVAIIGPRTGFKEEVQVGGRTVLRNPTQYAHLVEMGTRHAPAKPFLRPAWDEHRSSATEILRAEVLAGIEAAVKTGKA